jgi:polar amino acid transport system substrate-binding protein
MKFITFLLTLIVVALPSTAATAQETLRIGTEGAYPPFNYLDSDKKLAGFDVDIAKALCAKMGVECTFTAVPWENIIDNLVAGDYDVIIASMAKTEERQKIIDFTGHYYRSRSAFVARAGYDVIFTDEGLKGMRLGACNNCVQAQYLRDHFSSGPSLVLTDDTNQLFELLATGELDIVLSDSLNCLDFLKSERGADFDFVGEPLPSDDVSSSAHMAVRKGELELVRQLEEALEQLRMDGTYDRINRQYFPFNIY